jgi:hypothetical protein
MRFKKVNLENVHKILNSLGKSPTKAAHKLRDANVRGVPGNCFTCPIANYFKRKFTSVEVMVMQDKIEVRLPGITTLVTTLPSHLKTFVTRFDEGQYQYLEEKHWREERR